VIDATMLDRILGIIAATGNAAAAIRECKASERDFYRILAADAEVAQRYTRAKELGCHAVADEMLRLADECRIGKKVTDSQKDGVSTVTADMVERSRLQIETRKWLLARLMPKVYGERTVIAGDADNPLAVADVTDAKAELARKLGALAATAGSGDMDLESER
jgi:hypothetical protein